MTRELPASAVLIMQHNNLRSSFQPVMIAFLFLAAKSILLGTYRIRAFFKISVHLWRYKSSIWNIEAAFVWPKTMETIVTGQAFRTFGALADSTLAPLDALQQ